MLNMIASKIILNNVKILIPVKNIVKIYMKNVILVIKLSEY